MQIGVFQSTPARTPCQHKPLSSSVMRQRPRRGSRLESTPCGANRRRRFRCYRTLRSSSICRGLGATQVAAGHSRTARFSGELMNSFQKAGTSRCKGPDRDVERCSRTREGDPSGVLPPPGEGRARRKGGCGSDSTRPPRGAKASRERAFEVEPSRSGLRSGLQGRSSAIRAALRLEPGENREGCRAACRRRDSSSLRELCDRTERVSFARSMTPFAARKRRDMPPTSSLEDSLRMRDRTDRGDAADPSFSPQAEGRRVAIVTSRYHHAITSRLEAGAVEAYLAAGGVEADLVRCSSPGAFELVAIAAALAARPDLDGVVALGCIVAGETRHDRHLAAAVAQ